MFNFIRRLLKDESGQGMVEYGFIIAWVALVVIVALTLMGEQISAFFEEITGELGGAK